MSTSSYANHGFWILRHLYDQHIYIDVTDMTFKDNFMLVAFR